MSQPLNVTDPSLPMNMDPLVDFRRNPPPEKSLPELPEVLRAGSTLNTVFVIGGWVGSIAGAYHGYKRNDSVGWAIGWSLLGAFWPVTIPIMVAQGFGKPIAKTATANRKAKRNGVVAEPQTVRIRGGFMALARPWKSREPGAVAELSEVNYQSRTQAQAMVKKLGAGWEVLEPSFRGGVGFRVIKVD